MELQELDDVTKREPWHDESADWNRREEALRVWRMAEAQTFDVSQPHVPVVTFDEAERELKELVGMAETQGRESSRDKLQDFYIKELQESVSRISGFLFGSNGEGGSIRRIEDGQKQILDELRLDREERHRVDAEHAKQLANLDNRVGKAEHDINAIADKMRGGETWKKALINGGVFILLSGVGAIVALGIRAYMGG